MGCSCPTAGSAIHTKIEYAVLLLIGVIVQFLTLNKIMDLIYNKFSKSDDKITVDGMTDRNIAITYRIGFSYVIFFSFLSIFMIKVEKNSEIRSKIQNGYWGIKYISMIGLFACSFLVSDSVINSVFTFYVTALIAYFIFIIWQLILLVDFANKWANIMLDKLADTDNSIIWLLAFSISSFGLYIASITSIVLLYVYYGGCTINLIFISISLMFVLASGILSICPFVQKRNQSSGILQAAVVSCYIIYLTYIALVEFNTSSTSCTPTTDVSIFNEYLNHAPSFICPVGLTLFIFVIFYSSWCELGGIEEDQENISENKIFLSNPENESYDTKNVSKYVSYDYSFYHLSMLCGSLYIMLVLTNWHVPGDHKAILWPAIWVKISGAWISAILYIWILVSPVILSD